MFLPKVSCILPTGYGNRFVGVAIGCFLTQVYLGETELVIVDKAVMFSPHHAVGAPSFASNETVQTHRS